MMNEFIEKNRKLLKSYCIAARIIGWMLLIVAVGDSIFAVSSGHFASRANPSYRWYNFGQWIISGFILLGLLLLGVAQFIRYLSEKDYKPGWILRHGDKVLCLYAAVTVADSIIQFCWHQFRWEMNNYAAYLLLSTLPAIAKALIFVGLARVLRRLMPVVEESKTLI
jgi:hypothetical protein